MLDELQKQIIDFRNDRDWEQFHAPKNVAEGICIEAAELLENFLWKTTEESRDLSEEEKHAIGEEIADIAIYLLLLSHDLGLDFEEIISQKLKVNGNKYPIDKCHGIAGKIRGQVRISVQIHKFLLVRVS
ncbi:MAG: nucleotide pyrophosphohydrolase, partial [FCB group bacterium]|nr:nucleotide pyrophosphohydrolase [FCB group bacterium]